MTIRRYTANKDTTITNAYKENLITTATASNMGASDSMELFFIYGQASSASTELARSLIQFPISDITSDRSAGTIPASGSVNFVLRVFNVEHPFTLPRDFTVLVKPVSSSWEEGVGLDMETFSHLDAANWISSSDGTAWTTPGGDYHASPLYSQSFTNGFEDLEVDVTSLVEEWISGAKDNYGVGLMLTSSQETGSNSYYTKRFSARGSEFWFNRPTLEARWDNSRKDDRGFFFRSSSVATAAENLNQIFFYNFVRGQLRDLPNLGQGSAIYVSLHTSASGGEQLTTMPTTAITGGWAATGVYSASVAVNTTASVVYDKWFSGSTYYHTGTIITKAFGDDATWDPTPTYVTTCTNLRQRYSNDETARFRFFTRKRDWCPNVYTKLQARARPHIVEDAYWRLLRTTDDKVVIAYGTGSTNHTRLSYDVSGSFFDLDLSMLEKGFAYSIGLLYNVNGMYIEQPVDFKFRLED